MQSDIIVKLRSASELKKLLNHKPQELKIHWLWEPRHKLIVELKKLFATLTEEKRSQLKERFLSELKDLPTPAVSSDLWLRAKQWNLPTNEEGLVTSLDPTKELEESLREGILEEDFLVEPLSFLEENAPDYELSTDHEDVKLVDNWLRPRKKIYERFLKLNSWEKWTLIEQLAGSQKPHSILSLRRQ